ncbi:ABC transporter substrate-binding protein/permease [Streptococcus equi]|uniref:Glutamine ABC transporter, glutamine-binding protein/permease protein n=1 Tax=Streptococcus equi subsp. equi TaxID=148942 RepID=A0A380JTP6_9STRE|nr:ABC transporter substrate-binding protein/permease [Streptococcus equi]SUN48337.1 glutamine ABC transporter, glutamine-binding protein/permease protein [Streptococcus equi subsp. equi]
MKKLVLSCLATLLIFLGEIGTVQADHYLRVGMEAAYSPFNWTQDDSSNGAVPIEGTSQYANGYDVQIAKKIAKALNKDLLVVKTSWTGLIPALTSGKIDLIAAGMSPTAERKKEIAFSNSYYTSEPVIVVASNGKYAKARSIKDFSGAKVTAQQGVWHVNLLPQLEGAKLQTPMGDFSQMRQALTSGVIDGYISERPEAMTAETANKAFKMITLTKGFTVSESDAAIAIGMKKGDDRLTAVNQVLDAISQKERLALMDKMIQQQPSEPKADEAKPSFIKQTWSIFQSNWKQFLRGTGMTLLISMIGTITGLFIGLLIGIYRTAPKAKGKLAALAQRLFGGLLNVYIEVFRGTPMIVQSMVIYYGTAQAFGISIDRTLAAIVIVSINTGAYMSEIVRGGIFAVDKGQFEAATALGFTHGQTMRQIVLPQVVRNILPATGNEFVINIKDTSVLNVISVVELYFSGNTVATQTYQYFQTFTIIAIIYFVLTFTVTRILRYIERRFDADTYTTGANQMQVSEVPNV